jgi:chromosome segregation and condensation protein ScpB
VHLKPGLSQTELEAVAAVAYRTGAITTAEMQQMLGLRSPWETAAFLRRTSHYRECTMEDVAWEIATSRNFMRSEC